MPDNQVRSEIVGNVVTREYQHSGKGTLWYPSRRDSKSVFVTIFLGLIALLLFAESMGSYLYITQFRCWTFSQTSIFIIFYTYMRFWKILKKTKPRIKVLSECGLDSVDESHCVRDAVEGHNSCSEIHIHSYSAGAGGNREFSLFVIVPE